MTRIAIVFLTIFLALSGFGQSEIDPSNPTLIKLGTKAQQNIPFDKSFVIELNVEEGEVIQRAFGFEVFYSKITEIDSCTKQEFQQSLLSEEHKILECGDSVIFKNKKIIRDLARRKGSESRHFTCGDSIRIKAKWTKSPNKSATAIFEAIVKKEDKKKYHILVPPILPNTLFDIVFEKRFHGKNKEEVEHIFNLLHENNDIEAEKKFLLFKSSIEKSSYSNPRPYFMGPALFNDTTMQTFLAEMKKPKKNRSPTIKPLTSAERDSIKFTYFKDSIYQKFAKKVYDSLSAFIDTVCIDSLDIISDLSQSRKIDSVAANIKKFEKSFPLFHSLLNSVKSAIRSRPATYYCKGYTSFEQQSKIDSVSLKNRVTNLKENVKTLSQLDSLNQILGFYTNDNFENGDTAISKMKENLKYLVRFKDTLDLVFQNNPNFVYGEWISLQTTFPEIKTEGASRVIPDFGLTSIHAITHKNADPKIKTFYRPFFGINVGAPINKNQQLNEIENRSFRHRISWFLGLTIMEIDDSNFDDFFGKQTLITGFGYRLNRSMRLVGGLSLLREKNLNPIITSTTVEPGVFFGLSLDLELKNLFSNVFSPK